MQWLANISVRRPIFATVMIAVFLVVGVVGYLSLGVDKFPKVDFPLVTIVTATYNRGRFLDAIDRALSL